MTTDSKPVKIVLITGYLGAGKTTLLNRILANQQGLRAAVIVNDIGEVNVDASLIQNGGLTETDELIPMTNGCICCSLSSDLANQLNDIATSGNFDYIVIEASGICEPIPIAFTISGLCDQSKYMGDAPLELDNIVSVVDCKRLLDEFNSGRNLLSDEIEEDDIESLLIQQIEFCSTLILNKVDLVDEEQLKEIRAICRGLQRKAVFVEATNCEVPMEEVVNTGRFNFQEAYASAAWLDAMEHPEEHEDPEVLEYDISTFVYKRRQPFDIDKLTAYVETWPRSVIRTKGQIWTIQDPDMCYVFEQVGSQAYLTEAGLFVASAPESRIKLMLESDPNLREDWDPVLGDRQTKIVFIGRHMAKEELEAGLDSCLAEWDPKR